MSCAGSDESAIRSTSAGRASAISMSQSNTLATH